MKLYVDASRCQGQARCFESAPELYELDDLGHSVTRSDAVPDGLQDLARLTAGNCPERAITIEE
jgi:ferredoxin